MLVACSRDAKEGAASSGAHPDVPTSSASGGALLPTLDSASVAGPSAKPEQKLLDGSAKPLRGVIVISIDSLRADMPWNGYERPIAPRLTKFAETAVNYTNAYSISSYTSMSLGGFLGGTYPSELRRDGYFFGGYAPDNLFFTEILKPAGIYTIGIQAHGYFKGGGFNQGFDDYQVVPGISFNNTTDENITGPKHEEMAEAALSKVGDKKFFAWFHFMDPHDQYLSHPGISWGNKARDRYDAEVTFTDGIIGKLFDFIDKEPWGKEVAIIVTADHGEAFGEHGRYFHGFELFEEVVRVPLLVKLPGATPRKIATRRSGVDLAPTILELLAQKPGDLMRGTSLVAEVKGATVPARDIVLDLPTTSDNELRRAVITDHFKIIKMGASGTRVYDLDADPGEKTTLQGESRDKMVKRLAEVDQTIRFIPPTTCKEGCLNGLYAKAASSAAPAVTKAP